MLIRAESLVACNDANLAGRIVYWGLNGTVEYESLKEACVAADLPDRLMPFPPTSDRALKRSFDGFLSEHKLVARAIKQMPGYSLFKETQQPTRVRLTPELSVYVRDVGSYIPQLTFTPDDHPLCKEIRKRFLFAISELDSVAVSAWLNKCLIEVEAISLRPMGGFYFVPRQHTQRWMELIEPLKQTSHHRFYTIPALSTDDVMAAVLDGLTAEASRVAEEIEVDIQSGGLGKRALAARIDRCDVMNRKFATYEGVVNTKLDTLRTAFANLQVKASTMVLLAEEEKTKEKGR